MNRKRFCAAICLSLFLFWLAENQKDGFSLSLIQNPLFSETPFENGQCSCEMFSKNFHYLGRGRQAFVFESEDGKTVLKFFNQKYFIDPWYIKWARSFSFLQYWAEKELAKRSLRKTFYLNSYRIAASELKSLTGILYVHLNGQAAGLPRVSIQDKGKMVYEIDLNEFSFVLQKKGTPLYQALEKGYATQGDAGIEAILDEFLSAISSRIAKGIADADQDVEHNWGLVEGKVCHLDPGRLYYKADLGRPDLLNAEWRRATRSLNQWLKKKYPTASLYLEKKIEANIDGTIPGRSGLPFPISPALQTDG